MNEVWSAVVDGIIMALMAQALPVVYVVAQLREVLNGLDVVRFWALMPAAYLASIAVSFKHGLFPSEVVRAASALGVPMVAAFCDALALNAAIGVLVQHAVSTSELLAADATRTERGIGKGLTAPGTIDSATDMRGGPLEYLTAMLTDNRYLLGPGARGARTGAIPFLGILVPITVRFLGNQIAAHITMLESFWMGCGLGPGDSNMSTSHRAVFPRLVDLDALALIERYRFFADLAISCFHSYDYSKGIDKCQV